MCTHNVPYDTLNYMKIILNTDEPLSELDRRILSVLNPSPQARYNASKRSVPKNTQSVIKDTPGLSLTLNPRTYPGPKDNYPPDHIPTTYVPFKEYPELTYGALEEEFPASVSLPDNFNDLTTLIPALEKYAASCDMPLQGILRDIA